MAWTFCFVFLWGLVSVAQQTSVYTGPYKIGSYAGNAEFEYRLSQGDTIFHGPFLLQKSNLGALLEEGDRTFTISGAFQENKPSGAWQFRFGTFQSDSLTQVDGYQYNLKVSGTQHEAMGVIRNGRPDGLWTHTLGQIRNSQLEKTLFRSSIRFDEGVPQKTFRIEADGHTLVGRILRNGLAHDQWTLYSETDTEAIENWSFKEGRLLKIEISLDGRQYSFTPMDDPAQPARYVPLDNSYLALVKWELLPDSLTSRTMTLLEKNYERYSEINQILNALGEADYSPGFQVLAREYPLDDPASGQWAEIAGRIRDATTLSTAILEDPQLQIARRSDSEAQFLYELTVRVYEQYVKPLHRVLELVEMEILPYVNRDEMIERLWPEGVSSLRIPATDDAAQPFPSRDLTLSFSEGDSRGAIGQTADYALELLKDIQGRLGPRFARQKQQREQAELEKGLIVQLDEIGSKLDSLDLQDEPELLATLKAVQSAADRLVSEYSSIPSSVDKAEKAREVSQCLNLFNELAKSLVALPEHWESIRKAYTDQIWNPFTATIMDESVKRRITGAYRDVLIPYLLDEIRSNPDCGKAPEWITILQNAPARVLELREMDTAKLERRLRRVKDAQTVIFLFDLKPREDDK